MTTQLSKIKTSIQSKLVSLLKVGNPQKITACPCRAQPTLAFSLPSPPPPSNIHSITTFVPTSANCKSQRQKLHVRSRRTSVRLPNRTNPVETLFSQTRILFPKPFTRIRSQLNLRSRQLLRPPTFKSATTSYLRVRRRTRESRSTFSRFAKSFLTPKWRARV